jgi:hypothetical protein
MCDLCYDKNNNVFVFVKENENGGIKGINREEITKNENISSERQISNHGKINVLNNQNNPSHINNMKTNMNNNKNNITITADKKKICCKCCVIY